MPDSALSAEVAAIRSRMEAFGAEYADESRLLAAVEAVLERHAPTGAFPPGSDVCTECGYERDAPPRWPCPTVRDMTAKLLAKGDSRA